MGWNIHNMYVQIKLLGDSGPTISKIYPGVAVQQRGVRLFEGDGQRELLTLDPKKWL